MINHITNGMEYMSIDTDNKRFTIERICPVEDYKLVQDSDFMTARRKLLRDDSYSMRWILPKKSATVATIDDSDGVWIPKKRRMKCVRTFA